jgi:O-antigen ligase/Tfp pilus assembly protein PilF
MPASSETEPIISRLGRALLFIHLLLSPLVFQRGLIEVFEYPKTILLITTAILLAAGFVSYKARPQPKEVEGQDKKGKEKKGRSKGRSERSPFGDLTLLGMLLFLVSAFFSTLFSRSPITSLYGEHENFAGFITIASYTVLFFGTWALCRRVETCRRLLMASVVSVIVMVIYGVIQATGHDPFTWKRTAGFGSFNFMRIFGTMGHPNHLGAFLVMGLPIVCYFRLQAFKRGGFLMGLVLLVTELSAAALIVFSFSRGAWVAMGAAGLVFAGGLATVVKKRTIIFALLPWVIGLALGAFAFSTLSSTTQGGATTPAVTASVSPPQPQAVPRPQHSPRPQPSPGPQPSSGLNPLWTRVKEMGISDLTQGTRWPIWTTAFAMFVDYPLFGVGLDGFPLAFQKYRPVEYWHREWGGTPTRAHNEFLHILATQGLLGAIATLVITAGLGLAFIRILRNKDRPDPILPLAIFSGITGFYIQNIFSFTVIGCGTLFMTFAALLLRLSRSMPEPTPPPSEGRASLVPALGQPRLQSVGMDALILLFTGVTLYLIIIRPVQANRLLSHTVFNRSLSPSVATARLEKAVEMDGTRSLYFDHLASAYRKEAKNTKDPALRAALLKKARTSYNRAIDLVPIDAHNHMRLANLLLVMTKETPPLAETGELYDTLKQVLTLDPHNADFYLISADIATSLGDTRSASQWAMKCIKMYPHFAPPHAQLGFIALIEAVRLAKDKNHAQIKVLSEKAIGHLEQALPLFWANHEEKKKTAQTNLEKAYLFRAKAQERLGEFDSARVSYQRLLEVNPSHEEGKLAFEAFEKQRGDSAGITK